MHQEDPKRRPQDGEDLALGGIPPFLDPLPSGPQPGLGPEHTGREDDEEERSAEDGVGDQEAEGQRRLRRPRQHPGDAHDDDRGTDQVGHGESHEQPALHPAHEAVAFGA